MATFFIEQFGCRATQADAAAIERQLLARGCGAAPESASADVVIVNTCTVTAAADTQAREAVRAIHRRNPNTRIIVTGCYAQRAPEELAALSGVDWVVGNSHKPEIPRLVGQITGHPPQTAPANFVPASTLGAVTMSLARGPAKILTGDIFGQNSVLVAPVFGSDVTADSFGGGHTRPVLKIQDGCANRCAYCVIPFVRGRSRSLPPAEVLREINSLAAAGAREIVLSGINLGSYGRDFLPRFELRELLQQILRESALERLRLSSIEPMDITQELIDLFAANIRLARHFHIPLQSGCDRILAAMHRWYRAEHYAQRVQRIREHLPEAAIGADVIAGFPGETEADHAATMDFIRGLPFTYLHVFSFSKRPGTAAADLPNEVLPQIIQRRARELRALGMEKSVAFLSTQIGETFRVLTLHTPKEIAARATDALTTHYLRVRVRGAYPANLWLNVCVKSVEGNRLLAEPLEESSAPPYDSNITCASAC